ncbi:MAG: hypothetical protein ACI4GC_02095 [Acutalibacteraceae bacterium]
MQKSDKSFSISYSGRQDDDLSIIKAKYMKTEMDEKIKEVKRLDKSVDNYATMLSIFIGMIGTFFISTGIFNLIYFKLPFFSYAHILGMILILCGLLICSSTPFIHYMILEKRKEKVRPKILELIKEIEENQM